MREIGLSHPKCQFRGRSSSSKSFDAKHGCCTLWTSPRVEIMSQGRDNTPKLLGAIFVLVFFSAEKLRTLHPKNLKSEFPHFFRFPAGKMFLEVAVMAWLGEKSAGREDHDLLRGNSFHIADQFQPIFFCQMLDQVESHTAIELSWGKASGDFPHICQTKPAVRPSFFCQLVRRLMTFYPN